MTKKFDRIAPVTEPGERGKWPPAIQGRGDNHFEVAGFIDDDADKFGKGDLGIKV